MKISDFVQKDLVIVNLRSHTGESAISEVVTRESVPLQAG
jgi:hypothetical protein